MDKRYIVGSNAAGDDGAAVLAACFCRLTTAARASASVIWRSSFFTSWDKEAKPLLNAHRPADKNSGRTSSYSKHQSLRPYAHQRDTMTDASSRSGMPPANFV